MINKNCGNHSQDDLCISSGIAPICPYSLAVAYVPRQKAGELYSPGQAFVTGTVFPELSKPYTMPFGMAKRPKTDCCISNKSSKGGCCNE